MVTIDEIFGPAIQGEGKQMGVPSVFVRTGGCTLKCEGFGCKTKSTIDGTELKGCDSVHAVNAKHFRHTWVNYSDFTELVTDIEQCMGQWTNKFNEKIDVVFTGGEPTLHHKDEVLIQTLEYLISRGHRVWFETNGTVNINFEEYPIYKKVNFSISVKMSNSGEDISKRWKPEVVNNYIKNTSESYFKFVLNKEQVEEGASEILQFLSLVPSFGVVYVMPQGEVTEQLNQNAKAVYEFALKYGFRYSDRLHIRIYEDLRAV